MRRPKVFFGMLLLVGSLVPGCQDEKPGKNKIYHESVKKLFIKHKAGVLSLSFSPDSTILATGGESGQDTAIHFWSADTGKALFSLAGHESGIQSLHFLSKADILSAGYDETLRRWDLKTRKQSFSKDIGGQARAVAITPDGKRILVGNGKMLNAKTGSGENEGIGREVSGKIMSVSASSDGRYVAIGIQELRGPVRDGELVNSIELYEFGQPKPVKVIGEDGIAPGSLCFSPDGKVLFAGGYDNTVRAWGIPSGRKVLEIPNGETHIGRNRPIAVSPNGKFLAGTMGIDDDKAIAIWEVATGKRCLRLDGHRGTVLALSFSPDGTKLASGGSDGFAIIWRVAEALRQ